MLMAASNVEMASSLPALINCEPPAFFKDILSPLADNKSVLGVLFLPFQTLLIGADEAPVLRRARGRRRGHDARRAAQHAAGALRPEHLGVRQLLGAVRAGPLGRRGAAAAGGAGRVRGVVRGRHQRGAGHERAAHVDVLLPQEAGVRAAEQRRGASFAAGRAAAGPCAKKQAPTLLNSVEARPRCLTTSRRARAA